MRSKALILIAVLSVWVGVADAQDSAKQVFGLSGGFCVMPNGGEAKAIAGLAGDGWVVYVQAPSGSKAVSLRAAMASRGLLGRKVFVGQGPMDRVALAGKLADLVLVDAGSGASLDGSAVPGWIALLSPRRGVLSISSDDFARLERFSSGANWPEGSEVRIERVDGGGRLTMRRPALAGSDQWTHRMHGPDNNLFSQDVSLQAPFLPQYYQLPIHESFWGPTVVSAKGRLFTIRSSTSIRQQLSLRARSLQNGLLLWERPFEVRKDAKVFYGGMYPCRSCLIADGDSLLLIDGDDVQRLEAETGKEIGRIEGPAKGGQLKWIAMENRILAVLHGPPDEFEHTIYQARTLTPWGKLLAGYDLTTGKQLWSAREPGDVDERQIAIRDGKIYFHSKGYHARCRDLATGKVVWTNDKPEIVNAIEEGKLLRSQIYSHWSMTAQPEAILFAAVWARNVVALSPDDGSLLWKQPLSWKKSRLLKGYVAEGKYLDVRSAFDLKTGKELGEFNLASSGCGPSLGTPLYSLAPFGQCVDVRTQQEVRPNDHKGPCDRGTIVADGTVISSAHQCICNVQVQGYRAFTGGAEGAALHAAPGDTKRLEVLGEGPEDSSPATPADWPVFGRDNAHSFGASVSVATDAEILWRWVPESPVDYTPTDVSRWRGGGDTFEPDIPPTAPIAVGERMWFVDACGVIRCLESSSGKLLWSHALATVPFAAPTYWQGRLLVAGADGMVDCLDAGTGRVCWRFQATPRPRGIFFYGRLIDTWPVIGSVLVEDGTALVAAGYQPFYGVHVYALDARTGKVRWEQHEAGKYHTANLGNTAVGAGKLWLCSSTGRPVGFDVQTGRWEKPLDARRLHRRRGSHVAVLGDRWILAGGHRLSTRHDQAFVSRKKEGYTAYPMEADPPATFLGVSALEVSHLPPCWDEEVVIGARAGGSGIEAWSREKLEAGLSERMKQAPPEKPAWVKYKVSGSFLPADRRRIPARADFALWGPREEKILSAALARNAYVAAGTDGDGWKLFVWERSTGKALSAVSLPAQPVMKALCLDRHGRILVSLRDGSLVALGRK